MARMNEDRFVAPFRLARMAIAFLLVAIATPQSAHAADIRQKAFSEPEKAVEALIAATRSGDAKKLLTILGPDAAKLIRSGDPIEDRRGRNRFVSAYDTSHKIEHEGEDKAVLIVGKEEWPFPIPLLRQERGWRFDTEAGEEEILNRRIGRNELAVIGICHTYVEAQREFAAKHPGPDGHAEYAQRFLSTPGKKDGLYWPSGANREESPLGPLIAQARAEGFPTEAVHGRPQPYHGYFYKILTRQGKNAPGGTKDYFVNGHMVGGFALVAFPANYGNSGVMTFVVSQDGIVHEKNLGPKTTTVARRMTQYDPDGSWKPSR